MAKSNAAAPSGMGPSGWRDRLLGWRDRLIANRRFRELAAAFPLTRFIARRRAGQLFDLCAGFVYTQVLLACVRLRLFEVLAEGPATVAALARRLDVPDEGMLRLLRAARALDLVEDRGHGRFGLGQLGAAMVGNSGIAAMVEHHTMLYADLADPLALLRGEAGETELMRFWRYARSDDPAAVPAGSIEAYSQLMAASQNLVSAEILASYDFRKHRRLLDLGGGDGTFLRAVAAVAPKLELRLFDLPPVAERARSAFAAAGLADRAEAFGGSFLTDPLPAGADIVSLVRVIHDHDDAVASTILRRARAALPDGGTLLLAEPMAGTAGAEASGDAYFGFYLMAMGSGRPRTQPELEAMLGHAGFVRPRLLPTRTPLLTRIIVSAAPASRASDNGRESVNLA
jgi:demethylspheroidene O-methyltransferase